MSVQSAALSKVREYYCQYTSHVLKKHKTWHDGKLKYFLLNNKFQLYNIEDNVLLSSEFVTSLHQLNQILNSAGFGKEEHKIFSQFIVIIEGLHCQYERDIIGIVKDQKRYFSGVSNVTANPSVKDMQPISLLNSERAIARDSKSVDNLALRFNKPFLPPRKLQKNHNETWCKQPRTEVNVPCSNTPQISSIASTNSRSQTSENTPRDKPSEILHNRNNDNLRPTSLALDMTKRKISRSSKLKKHMPHISIDKRPKYSQNVKESYIYPGHGLTHKRIQDNIDASDRSTSIESCLEDQKVHHKSEASTKQKTREARISRRRIIINHEPIYLYRARHN